MNLECPPQNIRLYDQGVQKLKCIPGIFLDTAVHIRKLQVMNWTNKSKVVKISKAFEVFESIFRYTLLPN